MQVALNHGQGDVDHGGVEHDHQLPRAEHYQGKPAAAIGLGSSRARGRSPPILDRASPPAQPRHRQQSHCAPPRWYCLTWIVPDKFDDCQTMTTTAALDRGAVDEVAPPVAGITTLLQALADPVRLDIL